MTKYIMKTTFLVMALCLMGSSCKFPSDAKGQFSSVDGKVLLQIKNSKIKMQLADGRVLEAKAEDLNVNLLGNAKSGLYLHEDPNDPLSIQVFWIMPDRTSRQEQDGYVWMQSEIVIAKVPKKVSRGKMQEIAILHCVDGQVLVDIPSGLHEGGCSQDIVPTLLSRVRKR